MCPQVPKTPGAGGWEPGVCLFEIVPSGTLIARVAFPQSPTPLPHR